jgi:hypothetical protein
MFRSRSSVLGTGILTLFFFGIVGLSTSSKAQTISESTPHETHLTKPTLNIPANLSQKLTPQQQELLKKATPKQ